MEKDLSLQERYAPNSICFGCGPKNEKGLKIRSFPKEDTVVCLWRPEEHHQAFPGMLNGGILGALLDCHSNWTAAYAIMKNEGLANPMCTVTADFSVKLKRPTPFDKELEIISVVKELEGQKAHIFAEIKIGEKVYAECSGHFVAVKEGHPAYHRWG